MICVQRRIMFNNHLCIRWSIRMVYFSDCNQAERQMFLRKMWFTCSDLNRLCSSQMSFKTSDTAKKRLKALKIKMPEICKYLFNINGSLKHICVCFCSWLHFILSKDFPPLFVYSLTLSLWPPFLKIQICWSLNTWNWYVFVRRKERKLEPF